MSRTSRAAFVYTRVRYRVLFFTLLLALAVGPLSAALGLGAWALTLIVALNLVVAAAGIGGQGPHRAALVAATVLASVLRSIPEEALPPWLVMAAGALWLAIALMAMVAAVRFALRSTEVDVEHVAAALSAYLLAGVLFAVAYVLVDFRWPGSVVEPAGGDAGR